MSFEIFGRSVASGGEVYLERGGVTGVGFITLMEEGEVEEEDMVPGEVEGDEHAASKWGEGSKGRVGGSGTEGLVRRGNGKGGFDAPTAERAAEAAAAWR